MNALEIENLKKTFKVKRKKVTALKGMSFKIKKGEILGFLGPNGAGKSTTIKSIMGLIKPDYGKISILGKDLNVKIREKIGFLPENPSFIDALTGKNLLMLTATMYKIPKDKAEKKASELLKAVELESAASRSIRKYSKGMIQRIGFASAMMHEPEILILDEPMSGLDPMGRYVFKNMMKEINKKGTTIFFSSHIIPDMEDICDRVVVVKGGKMIKELDKKEIKYFATTGYKVIFRNMDLSSINYKIKQIDENLNAIETNKNELPDVLSNLKSNNCEIVDVEPIKKNLEELFVEVINE